MTLKHTSVTKKAKEQLSRCDSDMDPDVRMLLKSVHVSVSWSNAPQYLRSCNYFVGPHDPFIIGLPYGHPYPSGSQQFPCKTLVAR